ncbi:MAG: UDP-N-acetylmuramoyl-L-alanyl-D-glutamate--2,6-diaminopimelate ligase, partial [Phycisphaerae bacterium]|nr:UDP-N-acetylmuramoyl-L-alanyl-D-glutamate--2,6-diaminopimelate ligase [Phycisphaerae bacterium]
LLGTIEYMYGNRRIRAPMTTPDAPEVAGYFADMVQMNIDCCLMEVSSHALDQWRVHGIRFAVGAFTNLTPEHLDYHGDMVSYRKAKGRLFEVLEPDSWAVLNADDVASRSFAESTRAHVLWYGLDGPADVTARELEIDLRGSRFRLVTPRGEVDVASSLVGRHNVYNCLTAAAIAEALGVDLAAMAEGLSAVQTIDGRLEPVDAGQPFAVLVDYAHTDDALENALTTVKPLVKGRLILVFGCGGDRDRLKRPRMGRVVERFADVIFVTNDNPRSEEPGAIAQEIIGGFEDASRATVILDRRDAITAALSEAKRGDLVLIAGKGHEAYQEMGGVTREFDDRVVTREILKGVS